MLSSNDRSTVPLTSEQRNGLMVNSVMPVVIMFGSVAGVALVASCILPRFINAPFVVPFFLCVAVLFLVMLAVGGRHVIQHYADLRLGVSYVRTAELIEKRATTQSPRTFSAEFADIGALSVFYDVYQSLTIGQRYRVTYSPHTKRGWSVEPVESARGA